MWRGEEKGWGRVQRKRQREESGTQGTVWLERCQKARIGTKSRDHKLIVSEFCPSEGSQERDTLLGGRFPGCDIEAWWWWWGDSAVPESPSLRMVCEPKGNGELSGDG